MMKEKINIKTPNGDGFIEDIYVSELGYLMLRVKHISSQSWTTYNLGTHSSEDNMFTNLLLPTIWSNQFMPNLNVWHLTETRKTNGVISELFFETENEMLTYISDNNITIVNE